MLKPLNEKLTSVTPAVIVPGLVMFSIGTIALLSVDAGAVSVLFDERTIAVLVDSGAAAVLLANAGTTIVHGDSSGGCVLHFFD